MRKTKGTDEKINFLKENEIDLDRIAYFTGISKVTLSNYIGNDGKNISIRQETRRKLFKGINNFMKYHDEIVEARNKEIEHLQFLLKFIEEQQNKEENNNE